MSKEGQLLGNYHLVRLIGRGSLSEVYLGQHRSLQSQAAIKVLNTSLSPEAMENFSAEARVLNRVIHPCIIRLLDFGIDNEIPYVVMDYAPGGNLRQLCQPGKPLPLPTVVTYCQQIASALQHIHDQKLVHRDLKPENVLIGTSGEILLSDFGLAMITRHSTHYASTIAVEGTMAYMAPEQFRGKPRRASDQYALGIIVYELLSGHRPFTGTVAELCYQHLQQSPPSLPLGALGLPEMVEQVIFTALAKEPEQRFATVETFARALDLASQEKETDHLLTLLPSSRNNAMTSYMISPAIPSSEKVAPALPLSLTRLIGRDEVKEAVVALLIQPEVRLLTLIGAGGIGKTRLALAIASDLQDVFTDGVHFVQLAAISDPNLVLPAIAQALNIKTGGRQSPIEMLKASLHTRHLLLVLDNFEQVLSAAPGLTELLSASPEVTLLVTSRAALRVVGEQEFSLPPLSIPRHDETKVEEISQRAAVALFVERAQATKPDFRLTETNAQAVASICRHLDGLPLALELAAVRIKLLPPKALLARLSHRLQILTGGSQDLPKRQRTLRNTLQWSYDLLTIDEQRLFRRLSIFVGGCQLAAIEALSIKLGEDVSKVIDGVTSLLDKCLLQQLEQGEEESHLSMFETIREFGLECLQTCGELEEVGQAHAHSHLIFAEQAHLAFFTAKAFHWQRQLLHEQENWRTALQWFIEHRDVEASLRLASTFGLFQAFYGSFGSSTSLSEGRRFLEQAFLLVEQTEPQGSERTRAWAQLAHGSVNLQLLDASSARSHLEASLRHFRHTGEQSGIILAKLGLAQMTVLGQYDFPMARLLYEEALTEACTPDYQWGRAYALNGIGKIHYFQGAYDQAIEQFRESATLFQELGDFPDQAEALELTAYAFLLQGNYEQATHYYEESLAINRSLDLPRGSANALAGLGLTAVLQGRDDRARPFLEEALIIHRRGGERNYEAYILALLGEIAAREGESEKAHTLLSRGLSLAIIGNFTWTLAMSLECYGVCAALQGEFAWAARLWGAAAALHQHMDAPLPPGIQAHYTPIQTGVLETLGEEVFAATWADGEGMTPEQVLAARQQAPIIPPVQTPSQTRPMKKKQAGLSAEAVAIGLTQRELDVLRLLAEGLTNRQIAEQLVLSVVTVNSYLRSIYSKLGVPSRTAATRYALDHHLLE